MKKQIIPYKAAKALSSDKERDKKSASIFSKYFQFAVTKLKEKSIPLTNFMWRYTSIVSLRTITVSYVEYVSLLFVAEQLKKLKRNKVCRVDELPSAL